MSGLDDEAEPGGRVDERLARLLGPGPRHADDVDRLTEEDGPESTDDWLPALGNPARFRPPTAATAASPRPAGALRRAWEQRFGGWSFGPSQLLLIAVIVVLGLGLAGWSVLRARPVALASGPSSGGSAATGATTPTPGPGTVGGNQSSSAAPTTVPVQASATASPSSAGPMIEVHVLGAVKHPGVVELAPGSRVQDALDRAGGTKKSAHLGDLNLAQPLVDGQQIFIALHGGRSEVRDPVTVPPGGSAPGPSGSAAVPGSGVASASGSPGQVVNLNTATADELDQLPGVGPVTAQKIIDWRTQHGRFNSVEELQEVDGIGPKTYADLASMVTV